MPERTCIAKAHRVALPNTYHQRAPLGTGWFMMGPSMALMPRRSSIVSHSFFRNPCAMCSRSLHRDGFSAYLHVFPFDPDDVLRERVGRRARGHRAVLVVDAAVAGAHEEAGVGGALSGGVP